MAAKPVWTHLHDALHKWGDTIADNMKRLLRVDGTIASGKTANSIEAQREGEKIVFVAEAAKKSDYTVLEHIAQGRMPGSAPKWKTIKDWMEAKNIRPRRKGRFVKSTDGNMKRSAMAIQQAIYNRGSLKAFNHRGSNVIERSVNQVEQKMVVELLDAFGRDVEEFIEANRK